MKILALDSATEALSVSLAIDHQQWDRYVEIDRGHAEQLLPMVEALLAEGGISLASLDAIAFGRGPGGFTGVRLAASVAQGLAFGAGVGVVPVSDLAAVAQRVVSEDPGIDEVLVVNDARMREVYWARFTLGSHLICLAGEERVDPPPAVAAALGARAPNGRWVAGRRGPCRLGPSWEKACPGGGAPGVTFREIGWPRGPPRGLGIWPRGRKIQPPGRGCLEPRTPGSLAAGLFVSPKSAWGPKPPRGF